MKTLTILLALTFTVMFSSPSFADWKKVSESVDGDTFYVDLRESENMMDMFTGGI